MGKCEDILMEKEKDFDFLKYNLQELKTNFQGKQEEVDSLKAENVNIENEVKKMNDQNNKLKKQFEMKIGNLALKNEFLKKKIDSFENEMKLMKDQNEELRTHVESENNELKNKNQLLESKLDSLGNQLVVEKQLLCNNQSEIINVKTQVGEMKKNLIENMKSSQKQSENIEVQLSKLLKFDNSSFTSEVNKLRDEVKKANNEIRATRSHVDKTLNKKTNEINKLSAQVTISGKAVEENFNKLNCELKKQRDDVNSMRNCQETLVEKFNENEEEIGTLKVTNINIEIEMKLMKDQNEELRIHVQRENNELKHRNQLLENKLDSLGNQLVVEKRLLHNNQSDIINVKTQVREMNKNLIENMKSSQKQSENVEFQLSKLLKFDNSSFASEVNKLKDEVDKANNQIRATRSHVDMTLNKKTNEINTLSARVKRLSEHINLMKDNQEDINNAMKKVVTNIENILFCNSSYGSKDVVLEWKLQNYQYHFHIGEEVFSPLFFTEVKGYCFKLLIAWRGKEKENLGLFFKLCRGSDYDKPLEPFKMPFSLEMVDNKGNIFSRKIPLSHIEAKRKEFFTLPPGKYECEGGWGFQKFLSMPDLKNYILNDMLSIQCRLTPS